MRKTAATPEEAYAQLGRACAAFYALGDEIRDQLDLRPPTPSFTDPKEVIHRNLAVMGAFYDSLHDVNALQGRAEFVFRFWQDEVREIEANAWVRAALEERG